MISSLLETIRIGSHLLRLGLSAQVAVAVHRNFRFRLLACAWCAFLQLVPTGDANNLDVILALVLCIGIIRNLSAAELFLEVYSVSQDAMFRRVQNQQFMLWAHR